MLKRIFVIILVFVSIRAVSENGSHLPEKMYFGYNESYKKPNYKHNPYIIKSKYDYSDVTSTITKGCSSDYERICAIYKWICDNISYDTDYKIYDADKCWDERKGVCQAYCNLFYHMAKSVDIRVEIVGGMTKDYNGYTTDEHGWIFAYTKKDHGILLDPTWGAGSVDGNVFTRRDDCWIWFDVSPEWMILTHFPVDNSYQLLDVPISRSKFLSLPPVSSLWISYGMNANDIYDMVMRGELSLPAFYADGEGKFQFIEFPLQESLKIGRFYTMRVKMLTDHNIGIANNNTVSYKKDDWHYEGDGIYSIEFMPRETGGISFCIHDYDDVWSNIIKYDIENPTEEDWNMLKQHYPLDTPLARNVENLFEKEWVDAGVDNHKLFELIKEHNVKELPVIYTNMGANLNVISIPMNYKLKKGQTYTFSIQPRRGERWAIVNDDEWYYEWNITDDGIYTMNLTPDQSGALVIYVMLGNDNRYSGCIGYKVE